MTTLIITPTYNEKKNIKVFIEKVFRYNSKAHLLIVDDNWFKDEEDVLAEIPVGEAPDIKSAAKLLIAKAWREEKADHVVFCLEC